jgi:hypothetical protein
MNHDTSSRVIKAHFIINPWSWVKEHAGIILSIVLEVELVKLTYCEAT